MDVLCRHLVIPCDGAGSGLTLAAATYWDAIRAATRLGIIHRVVGIRIVPVERITAALLDRYGEALHRRATSALREARPDLSASTPFPPWMKLSWGGLAILMIAALFAWPHAAALSLWLVFLPYCAATMVLRAVLITRAIISSPSPSPPSTRRKPVVTILVPVYREKHSLPILVDALKEMDWPARALDMKILLEEEDVETIAEARWLTAGTAIDCLVVPPGEPRTKPKAMNVALPFARGEIVGILDAEDIPDPGQVAAAVAALDAGGKDVVCAQARLSHYNPCDNILTRCVAMEYALWFDMLLTGLSRARLPVPLGGTSLYIRADALRAVGGWDADNVTEDADLGLRLARAGKRAVVFGSVTHEEATGDGFAWIRQRSRWIKGFMLTWAVHMRSPRRLVRDLGWRSAIAINVLLLDGFLSFLMQPLMLLSLIVASTSDAPPWLGMLHAPGAGSLLAVLFTGQVLLLAGAVIASRRRFGWSVAALAPLLWFYWVMGGVAAVKALWQVATRPQYWEKTTHCTSPAAEARRKAALKDRGSR